MKDNAIKWLTELNPFDKVKGHTKIELTDVKTGKKQIIEKDNAFQAGVLAKYMRSMGAYNNNPYANSTWAGQPIWRNLCGGIFCFRDPIDNSEDEVEYMPAGNEMVANGAYMVNNAGTPIELGSYNEVESSTSGNDSVTFVYDWLTSQGNGTISCVCLSTEIGGYIGYGNPSGVAASTKKSLTANQSSANINYAVYDNHRWSFSYSGTTLHVTKTPIEVSKGSIFDGLGVSHDVTFSGSISSAGIKWVCYLGGGKIGIFPHHSTGSGTSNLNNGASYYFLIYDCEADTATRKTLTNNTGETLQIDYYYNRTSLGIKGADEQYVYLNNSANDKTYKFDIETGAGTLLINAGIWESNGSGSSGALMPDRSLIYTGTAWIYDRVNDTILPCNASGGFMHYNDSLDALGYHYMNYGETTYGIYKNPLILATINNLDTPVTKTAAQTMKITYTLTKASE